MGTQCIAGQGVQLVRKMIRVDGLDKSHVVPPTYRLVREVGGVHEMVG